MSIYHPIIQMYSNCHLSITVMSSGTISLMKLGWLPMCQILSGGTHVLFQIFCLKTDDVHLHASWLKIMFIFTSFYTDVLSWFIYIGVFLVICDLLYHVPDQIKLCNRAAWEISCITECFYPVLIYLKKKLKQWRWRNIVPLGGIECTS